MIITYIRMQPDLQALSVYADESYVNYQEAGKYKKSKVYVKLKSSSRKYIVRTDKDKKKYVSTNGSKVFLHSIRGQYKYVK